MLRYTMYVAWWFGVLWPHLLSYTFTCMYSHISVYVYLEVHTLSLDIYQDKGAFTSHTT